MDCEICGTKLQEHFLQKIIGTWIKDAKGKKHSVCRNCQRQLKTKDELLQKI